MYFIFDFIVEKHYYRVSAMVSVGSPRIGLISKCWSPVLKFECLCILSALATTISTLCSSSSDSVWMFEINLNPFPDSGCNDAFRAPGSSIIVLSQPVYDKITFVFTEAFRMSYGEIFLQLIKNRMYLALYGPTDLKSNADEAVMSSSSIWPCSMPRGP